MPPCLNENYPPFPSLSLPSSPCFLHRKSRTSFFFSVRSCLLTGQVVSRRLVPLGCCTHRMYLCFAYMFRVTSGRLRKVLNRREADELQLLSCIVPLAALPRHGQGTHLIRHLYIQTYFFSIVCMYVHVYIFPMFDVQVFL